MRITCLVISIGLVSPALAEDLASAVEFRQLKPVANGSNMAVGFSVKNLTHGALTSVFIDCAALDGDGNVIDTGVQNVQNLQAGETSFDQVQMLKIGRSDRPTYKCRVSQANSD